MQNINLPGSLSTAKNVIADAISNRVELFTIDHKSFEGSVFKVTYSVYGAQVINVYALTNGVVSDLPETVKKPKSVMSWCAPFPTNDPALFTKYVTYAKAVAKHVEAGGDLFPLYAFEGVEVPADNRFKAYDIDSELGYNPVVEASVFFKSHTLRTIEGVAPVEVVEDVEEVEAVETVEVVEDAKRVEAVEAVEDAQPVETVATIEAVELDEPVAAVETVEETEQDAEQVETIEEPAPLTSVRVHTIDTGETGTSAKDRAKALAQAYATLDMDDLPGYLKSSHYTVSNPICFEVTLTHVRICAVKGDKVQYLPGERYAPIQITGDVSTALTRALKNARKAYADFRDFEVSKELINA